MRIPRRPAFPLSTAHAERLVIGTYALAVGILLSRHEMWRDEAQQYLIIKASNGLRELLDKVIRDGHPALWYLLLYPILKAWNSLAALAAVNFLVSVTTVFTFSKYILRSTAEKVLFASGYYIIWQYAVISRSYMLGILLLGIAYAFSRKPRYVPIALVVLGLAANVHLYYFVTAVSFGAFLLWRTYYKTNGAAIHNKILLAASGIMVFFMAGAAVQFLYSARLNDTVRFNEPGIALSLLAYAMFPVRVMPTILVLPLTSILLTAGYCCFRNSRAVGCFFLAAVCGLALMQSIIYGGAVWHIGPIYLGLLISLLLAREAVPHDPARSRLPRTLLRLVLVLQVLCSAIAFCDMRNRPFSNGERAAAFLRDACPAEKCTLVAALDDNAATISAYLGGRPIYYVNRQSFGTYMIWSRERHHPHAPDQVVAAARRFDDPVMIFNSELDDYDVQRLHVHQVAEYSDAVMRYEDFYMYVFNRPS